MRCTFIPIGAGRHKCEVCGFTTAPTSSSPERIFKECGGIDGLARNDEVNSQLSFFRKVANFARAAAKQAPLFVEAALTFDESAALRTTEEVEAIYKICQGCDLLKDGACSHPSCGCSIDPERSAFWSKLAWKSTGCPIGKWPLPAEEVADVPPEPTVGMKEAEHLPALAVDRRVDNNECTDQ